MSPLTAYHSLLLSNLSTVQTIESGLSNVTWLLPGRFEDAELASEGVYALLGLVSNYHDEILYSHIPKHLSLPPHPFISQNQQISPPSSSSSTSTSTSTNVTNRTLPLLPAQSEHTRYTRYWTTRSPAYKRASKALNTIGYVQLVVEMIAKRKGGDRVRWKVVLIIEMIKTFLRLTILRITKRPVLAHPVPQREIDPSILPPESISSPTNAEHGVVKDNGNIKSTPLTPSLAPYAPLRDHLYPMIDNLPETHLDHPLNLLHELKGKEYISEIIWSSIGLINVLLLMRSARQTDRYKSNSLLTISRSYIPYLSVIRMLLLARYLRPKSSSANASNLLMENNAIQDKRLLVKAFLTGPMWLGFTRPKILSLSKGLERIPLVGLVGELVEGYLPLVDDYFYCRSHHAASFIHTLITVMKGMKGS
ncbi:uncharacterized protein I303_105777 [Kwoniella dejecticola CBS 10117]|uniref:Peroxisomal membrane protein PEX16 n=1 Tax=Kwoniella dejecticola CBS 10117 TaxID=1296121 RepID=A0A1A6A0C5_9TREE|nr:uncharacterized protein I303_05799 [Kwoniella dejecticola CBS 10117]OBR83519.1 hypothetical protein I303_05799 [Kwoniella dejecticola CBS 10117]